MQIYDLRPFLPLSSRYQPDGALERRAGAVERDCLSSEEGESDLTESECHLNMLKGGSSTLQAVLHPPVSPSEHSSSVVNMSISVLGRQAGLMALTGALCAVDSWVKIKCVFSHHSAASVCGQLSHHIPCRRDPWYESVGPGIAVRMSPHLQWLHLHGLQAASDEQEGLLYGA